MMKRFLPGMALAVLAWPAMSAETAETAEAPFHDRNGKPAGHAVLTQMSNGMLIAIALEGLVRAHVVNSRVSLAGKEAPLLDKDDSALVIHAKADDYRSQPSGAAGDRIACAVVQSATK